MALTKASFQLALNATMTRVNTGFNTVTLADKADYSQTVDVTAYTFCYIVQGTIAGGANTTIDLFGTLTDLLGNSTSAKTKFLGLIIATSGTAATASLTLEPGASNPLTMGFAGTSPTLTVDAGGCIAIVNADGQHETVSSTVRNIKLSNPGSTTVTYDLGVILG